MDDENMDVRIKFPSKYFNIDPGSPIQFLATNIYKEGCPLLVKSRYIFTKTFRSSFINKP